MQVLVETRQEFCDDERNLQVIIDIDDNKSVSFKKWLFNIWRYILKLTSYLVYSLTKY